MFLQGDGIHHRCQHSHVVRPDSVHTAAAAGKVKETATAAAGKVKATAVSAVDAVKAKLPKKDVACECECECSAECAEECVEAPAEA